MNATVARAGFLTTVQDLGRTGLRQFGVSAGGALDPHALRVANLLAGNNELAAGLEITLGGLRLRFNDPRVIAWCGGEFEARLGPTLVPAGHSTLIQQGEELTIDRAKTGCRAWVAISGGIDVAPVLGSRSTDLRANFGGFDGRALRDADEVPLGINSEHTEILIDKLNEEKIARWKPAHDWSSPARREPILRFVRGSNSDRFDDVTFQRFTAERFIVSPDSDRMGARFESPELKRNDDVDLVSEAVAPGTIQVPPAGKPILLLGDCQTIGGYPKIAHVITVDLPIAAQLRPGDQVRFREVSLADAHQLLIERERNLEQFRRGLEPHFS
jgi:antagonist of KipI